MQVLSVDMTSIWKSYNEVTNYVKKVEGVRRDVQAEAFAKRDKKFGNFQGPMLEDLVDQHSWPNQLNPPCSPLQVIIGGLHTIIFSIIKVLHM